MINLTVKTLDSQNHAFSLDDDQITVRGFKEHIAESVAVPADSQRLIYCGRVLQDEKKLNDYDVNGKVIHLVQRAPPQPSQRGNDGGQTQGQGQGHGQGWQNPQRSHYRLTRTQMHGNAMYLGAMSVPAEIVEGHGFPVPQLSNSLSTSRLVVASRMLERVNSLLDQLDNNTTSANAGTSEGNPPQSPELVGIQDLEDSLGAALSATGAMFQCNSTAARGTSEEEDEALSQQSDPPEESQAKQRKQSQQPPQPQPQQQPQPPQQPEQSQQSQQPQQDPPPEQQESTSSANGQANRGGATLQLPRPQRLAELLNRLLSSQDRLRPYLERYFVLMRTDPPIRPGIDNVEEYTSVVTGVSEILHCLSHACHALSDIIVDMNQQPPRNLRCRPIIIQHSAILQAGIPIQLEAHISLHGRNANNNNTGEESTDNVNFVPPSDGAEASESSEASGENAGMQQPESDNATPLQQEERQQQDQTQTPFGAVFNLPNNVEVLMEVGPDSNLDGLGTGEPNQQTEANNNNSGTGRVSGNATVFPWGSAPAPDFIRNVMQAVAGHMVHQSQMATTTITTPNTPITVGQQTTAGSMDGTGANGGQSTQARSNVGTHPTTATQTRSTSRPHVFHQQSHPLGVGMSMGQGLDFDPFLPCNSHHIRRTPSTTPSTVTTASQTTTTNQTPAQESTTAQTQSASSSTASSSATPANTTSPTTSRANGVDPLFNLIRQFVNDASGSGQTQVSSINVRHNEELSPGYPDILTLLNAFLFDRQVSSNIVRDRTLADLLQNSGVTENLFPPDEAGREDNLIFNLYQVVTQNMTLESLTRCKHGRWEPIAQLRRPLQEFFEQAYRNAGSSGTIQEYVTERLMSVIRRHLQVHLSTERNTPIRNGSRVDLYATAERLVSRHISEMAGNLFAINVDDARFGQEILNSIRNLGQQLCTVIRYSVHHGRTVLEFIASRFVFVMLCGLHDSCRPWLLSGFLEQFTNYCVRLVRSRESILPLLVYTDAPAQESEESASPVSQISTAQDEPEQMDTEPATTTKERLTNKAPDPPEEDDTEDIPETFPGHENLPSGWVPIIARDGVRQRRQLQMQGMANGGVATFSDAYLGGLPSKRRKIIEQQKPRLPVSPTPNRTSVITASMECLVREGIGRAGVEEVEGAAVAVAADPGVRRAFGQAVRDCLNPHRYGTPDFPDPLRFPNATKYFADQERSPKQ